MVCSRRTMSFSLVPVRERTTRQCTHGRTHPRRPAHARGGAPAVVRDTRAAPV